MWAVTAIGVTIGSSVYQVEAEKKAAEKAEDQAKQDKADALRAEQFSDTEGEGQGQLGNINLAIDEDVDSEVLSGSSNISI
jgi:hypothetical protein